MAENASLQPKEEEPESKRQKMSSTSGDEQNPDSIPTKPKCKRRKIAIFLAYCGVGYQGMQKNPGAKTIEGDLEEALYLSGAVPESDRGQSRLYDWARSARTDKGVSAVGQVISGRFYVDPPGFIERLNSNLVPQIRVFGYKRATPAFSSKKFCDRRRYVYLIPVFALDPSCHRDRESVLASLGSGSELVKCLECSERGRKVFGVMGKRSYESKTVEVGSVISSNNLTENKVENNGSGSITTIGDAQNEKMEDSKDVLGENNILVNSSEKGNNDAENVEEVKQDKMEDDKAVSVESNTIVVNSSEKGNAVADDVEKMKEAKTEDDKAVSVENNIVATNSSEKGNGNVDIKYDDERVEEIKEDGLDFESANEQVVSEKKTEFKYGEEEKETFNRILKYYEGTHNYHNFTTRMKAEDPAAKRYILSFNANTVISVGGIDFVKCEVVGQSFMLHQIRKMIGLAVAIMRNCAPESLIEAAFKQKVNINVPMAPEVGLYLDECFFPSYNQKWQGTHEELSMKDYTEEAEEFKMKYIYPHIASTEHKEGSMAIWLHSLNYRNYPDLRFASDGPSSDGLKNDAVDNSKVSDAKQDKIINMDE